jgi:hypothetical protein
MTFKKAGTILTVLLAILLACAGCGERIPEGETGIGGLWGPDETPTVTVAPTQTYLTPATPFATPAPTSIPQSISQPTPAAGTEYFPIYNDSLSFNYDIVSYVYDLKYSPMIIDILIHPEMVERTVETSSDYGDKDKITIKKLIPNEMSEFKITVYNKNTGDIIAEEGYGKSYNSFSEEQTITIRVPGLYQIEMTGRHIEVDIDIQVAKENIV